ncbi:hypothetical protein ENBRE01_0610 [Enteropsectra breve]|nr:hypothetical protein ENBRE01_0610 [Enteropsectra breve]
MKCSLKGVCMWYLLPQAFSASAEDGIVNEQDANPSIHEDKIVIERMNINGLKINVISIPKLENTFFSIDMNVGLLDSPSDCLGLAFFLTKQITSGSTNYKTPYLLHLMAPAIGAELLCVTDNDFTKWHFTCKNNSFEKFIGSFISQYCRPSISDAQALDIAKDNFDSYLRTRMDLCNSKFLTSVLLPCIAKKGAIIQGHFLGSRGSIEGVTPESLLAFQKHFYTRENTTITLITSLKTVEAEEELKYLFNDLPSGNTGDLEEKNEMYESLNFSDLIKEEFQNKIILFRNRRCLDESTMERFMFILIPLPKITIYDQRAVYEALEQLIDVFVRPAINRILYNLDYAYSSKWDIEVSTKSFSFLRIQISPKIKGHNCPVEVSCVFKTFFKIFQNMVMNNLSEVSTAFIRAYHDKLRETYSEMMHKRKKDKKKHIAISNSQMSLLKYMEQSKDMEWLIHNEGQHYETEEIIKQHIVDTLNDICANHNWVLFSSSARDDLKAYENIDPHLFLGAQEMQELNPSVAKKIEDAFDASIIFRFNSEKMAFDYIETPLIFDHHPNTVIESHNVFLTYVYGMQNAAIKRVDNGVVADDGMKKASLLNTKDSFELTAFISNFMTFTYSLSRKIESIPVITAKLEFSERTTPKDKFSSLFAIYIAYVRLLSIIEKMKNGVLVRTEMQINFNVVTLFFQGPESLLEACYGQFLEQLEIIKCKKRKQVKEKELLDARQFFVNLVARLLYANIKIHDISNNIFESLHPLPENEADILKKVSEMTSNRVILHNGVRLLLAVESVTDAKKMIDYYEKGIKLMCLKNTSVWTDGKAEKLERIMQAKEYEIKYEHSLCNAVLYIVPFASEYLMIAEKFLLYFEKIYFFQYLKNEMTGNLGHIRISDSGQSKNHFVLAVQGKLPISEMKEKLVLFWSFCREKLADKDYMYEIQGLQTDDKTDKAKLADNVFGIFSFFINNSLELANSAFVVSNASY